MRLDEVEDKSGFEEMLTILVEDVAAQKLKSIVAAARILRERHG